MDQRVGEQDSINCAAYLQEDCRSNILSRALHDSSKRHHKYSARSEEDKPDVVVNDKGRVCHVLIDAPRDLKNCPIQKDVDASTA